eukprot:TRINITY_DN14507_c0_g1_i1.p1 TRINITY_DN14507_c0_g1~~TRINITY_DN14507_c0_g1_i1.p1  ORF type:complete len:196 (-),score=38.75 TRINITY_DN14507_c0_g1_i1:200-787(-)
MTSSPAPVNVPVDQSPTIEPTLSKSAGDDPIKAVKDDKKGSLRKWLLGGATVGAICLIVGLSVGLSSRKANSHSDSQSTESVSKDSGSVITSTTTSSSPDAFCALSEEGWTIYNLNSHQFCVVTHFIDKPISSGTTEVSIPYSYQFGSEGFIATIHSSTDVSALDCDSVGRAAGESLIDIECPPQELGDTEYGAE